RFHGDQRLQRRSPAALPEPVFHVRRVCHWRRPPRGGLPAGRTGLYVLQTGQPVSTPLSAIDDVTSARNNQKGLFSRVWRVIRRVFLILFILQLVYIVLLKWVNPPITMTQLGSLFGGDGLKRTYVSLADISPNVRLAVISTEDQLFPDHDGFDFKNIEKAMKHNQKSKSLHGASTISQQVAKNVFLWQGRSWF